MPDDSTGYVVIEKRSEWEGCRDGAQADFGERLNVNFLIGSRSAAPDSSNLLILWLRG